jgi:hypothetical protein
MQANHTAVTSDGEGALIGEILIKRDNRGTF